MVFDLRRMEWQKSLLHVDLSWFNVSEITSPDVGWSILTLWLARSRVEPLMAGKKQDKFLSLFFNIFWTLFPPLFSPKKGPSWVWFWRRIRCSWRRTNRSWLKVKISCRISGPLGSLRRSYWLSRWGIRNELPWIKSSYCRVRKGWQKTWIMRWMANWDGSDWRITDAWIEKWLGTTIF